MDTNHYENDPTRFQDSTDSFMSLAWGCAALGMIGIVGLIILIVVI